MARTTRIVKVGTVLVGTGYPCSVQTMWKEPLTPDRLDAAAARVDELGRLGCDILRFAVPDLDAADTLGELASRVSLPLVADIHFDWKIALRILDFPIAKVRINPGNIGAAWKVKDVADKARDRGVPIRIGVNAGSLPADLRERQDRAAALVEAAEREAAALDALGFRDIIVSMKASGVKETIEANRLFASRNDIPLHIGVTEAGPAVQGSVRSAVALHRLLEEGIGETLRVSLSSGMDEELIAGKEIVALATGVRSSADIISCPRCGRAAFDTHAFTAKWGSRIYSIKAPVTVAVMGCVVNGPGEAKHADLGITGAGDSVILFRKGKIFRTVSPQDADAAFEEALAQVLAEAGANA